MSAFIIVEICRNVNTKNQNMPSQTKKGDFLDKIYEIELKYKNKERDLERKQKAERESYERIISTKGRKKYSSRSMPKKY